VTYPDRRTSRQMEDTGLSQVGEKRQIHSAKTRKGLCQPHEMGHPTFLVSLAESLASSINLAYSVGLGLATTENRSYTDASFLGATWHT